MSEMPVVRCERCGIPAKRRRRAGNLLVCKACAIAIKRRR